MLRRTLSLALLAFAATAQAQVPYRTLDEYQTPGEATRSAPGVRVGLGVGAGTYFGPNVLFADDARLDDQADVRQTRPAVTAFVSFPLASDRLYGRLQGGVLNLGAGERRDLLADENPFLTETTLLAEADLLLNLLSYRESPAVPYVFSGFGGLFAGGEAAYFIPLGLGVDFRLTRNLSLFLEGSYRFVLNEVGERRSTSATANSMPCDDGSDLPECQDPPRGSDEYCKKFPEDPVCVLDDGDERSDRRFGTGFLGGGLQLGFAPPPPVAYIPPPPPVVVVPPPVVVVPEPVVCDLVELNSVYFDSGSATLSPGARSLLAENVALLNEHPECCIFIDGYTDSQEYDRFGMPLAGRRAQAVYDYYLERGVGAGRMHVRNRGASVPSCDKEDPEEGCRRGRRVETIPLDCERFRFLIENPSYD